MNLLNSSPERRSITTAIGLLIMGFSIVGLFLSSIQLVTVVMLDSSKMPDWQPSEWKLYVGAIITILPKLTLLLVGVFILLRERLALSWLGLAFFSSLLNALWQWFVAVSPKLQNMLNDAQRIGFYVGAYAVYFSILVFYLLVYFYLRSPITRKEFAERLVA